MLANREKMRREARVIGFCPINGCGLEGDLPTLQEFFYLRRGLAQPGGKLPLFDLDGQEVSEDVVRRCLGRGWAEPWFNNPAKPDWLVCKLTPAGRQVASAG